MGGGGSTFVRIYVCVRTYGCYVRTYVLRTYVALVRKYVAKLGFLKLLFKKKIVLSGRWSPLRVRKVLYKAPLVCSCAGHLNKVTVNHEQNQHLSKTLGFTLKFHPDFL